MTRKAISRILFAFACMFVMVFALGMQEPKTVAHALVNQTERPTYVEQDIVWTNFPANYSYTIDSNCRDWVKAGSSTPYSKSNRTLSLYVTTNTSTSSRTGYVYATLNGKKLYTLTIVQGGHSHIYGGWTITRNATCTYDGSKYCTCHICGQRWTQSIPHLGHSNTPWKVEQQPTCGAAGVEAYTCTRCGYRETRSYGSPTGKHTYGDWFVSKKPTCTAQGIETRKCTGCSATQNRSISSLGGHVYIQTAASGADENLSITLKCKRCNTQCVCNKTSQPVKNWSDVILCYQRPDGTAGFRSQTESLLDYKMYYGNYGHDAYLFFYSTYAEYNRIWNAFIPTNTRNIYDYGHASRAMVHEFYGETVSITDIIMAKKKYLSRKNLSGNIYIFTCRAGNYMTTDLLAPVAHLYDGTYSILRYYAYLCPDAYAIGIKDDSLDYDEYDNELDVWLPTPHIHNENGGKFVAERFDSATSKCDPTVTVGRNIKATFFLDNYL